jgi:hypothetical protein
MNKKTIIGSFLLLGLVLSAIIIPLTYYLMISINVPQNETIKPKFLVVENVAYFTTESGLGYISVDDSKEISSSKMLSINARIYDLRLISGYLYLACSDLTLKIVNIDNVFSPYIYQTVHLKYKVKEICELNNSICGICENFGLVDINITNPINPTITKYIPISGEIRSIACCSHTIYMALVRNDENDESIKRLYFGKFNLTTEDFDILSKITTLFFETSPISIVLFENKVIMSFDYYITIIDNDTLTVQQWIYRSVNIYPANAVISLKISDGFLYVIGNNKWIELLELSKISSEIFLLFHLKMAIKDMCFSENKIYLLYDNGIESGIASMLKTEFYSQSFSYKLKQSEHYNEFTIINDLLYAGGINFHILNLSNSIRPFSISKLELEGYLEAPYVQNKIAFIPAAPRTVPNNPSGLYIINVSNSENPQLLSHLHTADPVWQCEVINDYAYLANHDGGLVIVNVSDLYNPQVMSSCKVASGGWARYLAVSENYAYVASGTGGLSIIDISNKSNPRLISSIYGGNIGEVKIIGDYAYFSSYSNIRIANVSNPVNPIVIRTLSSEKWYDIFNFQIQGNLMYVITENSYDIVLNIIDISNHTNPQILNSATFAHDLLGSLSQFAIYMDYIIFSYNGYLYKIYNNFSNHYDIQTYLPISENFIVSINSS